MHTKIKIFLILLLTIFFSSNLLSITIDEAVKYALGNSEDAIIKKEDVKLLKETGKQATSSIKPLVSLNSQYIDLDTDREITTSNPYVLKDITAEVSGSQVLLAGGKIINSIRLKNNIYKQANILSLTSERDIIKNVKSAFNLVLLNKAMVEIEQDRVKQQKSELNDVEELKKVGMSTILDLRQAELMLNFAENALKSAETEYNKSLIDFNNTIGNIDKEFCLFEADGKLNSVENLNVLIEELNKRFLEDTIIDIQTTQALLEEKDIKRKITRSSYFPTINLVGSYKKNGTKTSELDNYWSSGVAMEWVIMSGGVIKSQDQMAKIEILKARKQKAKIKKTFLSLINKMKNEADSLSKRIKLQEKAVELSDKNYQDARAYYKEGAITLTRLGEFNLNYREARYNLQVLFYAQNELLNSVESFLYH